MYVGISSVIVVAATDDNALRVEEVAAVEVRRRESMLIIRAGFNRRQTLGRGGLK